MVGGVRVTTDVGGILKTPTGTYKAQYDVETGQLILEAVTTGQQMQPGKPGGTPEKTQEAKPAEGGQDVPRELASLKVTIERVLKQNRATKLSHNQLKGKLTLKSRALTKSQSGSESIHSKKTKAAALGYNVILLVDNSGSMRGDKIDLANAIAKGLHATLHKTEGINVKVLAFQDYMRVVAGWNDPSVQNMGAGGGNADAAACYVAMTRHFNDAPNQNYRNILLVLSDGEPCSGTLGEKLPDLEVWGYENENNAGIAQFLRRTAREQGVYIAGLGIQNNSTQIPNSRQVDNLTDVQRALVTILKGAIDSE